MLPMIKLAWSCLFIAFIAWLPTAAAQYGPLRPISYSPTGAAGNADSMTCSLSGTGRHAVFVSLTTNLAAGTTNGMFQILLKDRYTGNTELISKSAAGVQGNGDSSAPVISANGELVVFESSAANLVVGDNNGSLDIFLHNRVNNTITRISSAANGGNADGDSGSPALSSDGRYVVFLSTATNLTAGMTSGVDVYLRDLQAGTTARVNLGLGGAAPNAASWGGAPALSSDGRFVVFGSQASNLVAEDLNNRTDVFIYDHTNQTTEIVSQPPLGQSFPVSSTPSALGPGTISADGRYVVFGVDFDGDDSIDQVYLRDRLSNSTELLSRNSQSLPGNDSSDHARINSAGTLIVFDSLASDLSATAPQGGVFLKNRITGALQLLNQNALAPCLDTDGTVIGFDYNATAINQVYAVEEDSCLGDPNKENPGICGCGVPDAGAAGDSDSDGVIDCLDGCPGDANKTAPGVCGCGAADIDTTGDGTPDCEAPGALGAPTRLRLLVS